MLFIDSSTRLKYDRQLEYSLEPKCDSNAHHSPWLAGVYERVHLCVHVRACACMCVCGSGFVSNISSFTKH